MTLDERIESLSEIGRILRDSLEGKETGYTSGINDLITNQQFKNPWFTPGNVRMAISSYADLLTDENLLEWTGQYPEIEGTEGLRSVGVVMAGNIPLVGFHDFLSVLISGNRLIAKTSSRDQDIIVFISNILFEKKPVFKKRITFTDGLLKGFDAVIATGSDNTSRYFEYYFGRYPHIIRKNRNSIAIIEGDEADKELSRLGKDIFSYFGLGCRSISKIYLPAGYDIEMMTLNWESYSEIINHYKYLNNYDYNKAVLMVNREKFTDTGYVLLVQTSKISSPVAVLNYEYYDSTDYVYRDIERLNEKIQCVVSRRNTPFGEAQSPRLWDYSDGVDTLDFLLKKIYQE
jgi:hypothetical protein